MISRSDRRWRAFLAGEDLPYIHLSSGVVKTIGGRDFVECHSHFIPVDQFHETEAEAVRSTLPRLEQLYGRLGELIAAVRQGRSTIARPGDSGPSAAGAAQPEVASNAGSP